MQEIAINSERAVEERKWDVLKRLLQELTDAEKSNQSLWSLHEQLADAYMEVGDYDTAAIHENRRMEVRATLQHS